MGGDGHGVWRKSASIPVPAVKIEDVIYAALPELEDDREEQRYEALFGLGAAVLSSTGLDAVHTMAEADNAADRSRAVDVLGAPGGDAMEMDASPRLSGR